LFNLSDAQIKLLDHRNIVLVDLGECPDVDGNHSAALERFFNYLSSRKKEDSRLGWPENNSVSSPTPNMDKTLQAKEIVNKWEQDRLQYPGWVVVPEDRRQNLWRATTNWTHFISKANELPEQLDLSFAYELNWRFEHCLIPLSDNILALFKEVTDKYWALIELKSQESSAHSISADKKYQQLNWKGARKMVLSLAISMLRFYREEGLFEPWEAINKKVDSLIGDLSQEDRAFLHYERVLYALFKLDISQVKLELTSWPTNFAIPFWETKRAGLLAEIGRTEEAERILERSLREIRSNLNLKPVTSDYSLVSEEASTMLLLQYVKNPFGLNISNVKEQQEIKHQFSKRFDALTQYKCDPWNEIKLFENQLERFPVKFTNVSEKYEFDIGRVSKTHHFMNEDTEAITAYNFLRYLENSGFPFRVPGSTLAQKSVKGTLQRISRYSLYWAIATLIRSGDKKAFDEIFSRQALLEYSPDKANKLIDQYLSILLVIDSELANVNSVDFSMLIAQTLPEILSRLCCKCSTDKKPLLLNFLAFVYASEYKHSYLGIKNLFNRLAASLSPIEKFQIIPKLLDIPYPVGLNSLTQDEYANPFSIINITKDDILFAKKIELNQSRITSLLELAISDSDSKRTWAVTSLYQLYKLDLLSEETASKFGEVLWSKTGGGGFPNATSYYKFAFLDTPHPENIVPEELFKSFIKTSDFPIYAVNKDKGFSIIQGPVPLCNEISRASDRLSWSQEEVKDIFEKLVRWWDLDKEFLLDKSMLLLSSSMSEEFKRRFLSLKDTLIRVIISMDDKEAKSTLNRIIDEFDEYGIPATELKAAAFCYQEYDKQALSSEIDKKLNSENTEEVVDGVSAILLILKVKETDDSFDELLLLVGQIIRWNSRAGLMPCLTLVKNIIKEHSNYFADELEAMSLQGLSRLAKETSLDNNLTEKELFTELKFRQVAASVAYQLSIFYVRKHSDIPNEVLVWKNICESDNEFSEVKAQWECDLNE